MAVRGGRLPLLPKPRRARTFSRELDRSKARQDLSAFDFDGDDGFANRSAAAEAPAPSRPKAQRPLITKRTALGDASNAARPKAATGRKRVDHSLRRSSGREPSDTSSVSSLFSLSEPSLAASFRSDEGSPAADEYDSFGSSSSPSPVQSPHSSHSPRSSGGGEAREAAAEASAPAAAPRAKGRKLAYFAMGCYWHAEAVFGGVDGVTGTQVGFINGVEVVRVTFDTAAVEYTELLRVFREGHELGKKWANKKFESAVFAGCTQRQQATDGSGGVPVYPLAAFTPGKDSDQLYHVRQKLPKLIKAGTLSEEELSKLNYCLAFSLPYDHIVPKKKGGAQSVKRKTAAAAEPGPSAKRTDTSRSKRRSAPKVHREAVPNFAAARCPLDGPCTLAAAPPPPTAGFCDRCADGQLPRAAVLFDAALRRVLRAASQPTAAALESGSAVHELLQAMVDAESSVLATARSEAAASERATRVRWRTFDLSTVSAPSERAPGSQHAMERLLVQMRGVISARQRAQEAAEGEASAQALSALVQALREIGAEGAAVEPLDALETASASNFLADELATVAPSGAHGWEESYYVTRLLDLFSSVIRYYLREVLHDGEASKSKGEGVDGPALPADVPPLDSSEASALDMSLDLSLNASALQDSSALGERSEARAAGEPLTKGAFKMVSTANSFSFNTEDLAAVVHHALVDVYTLSQQQEQLEAEDVDAVAPLSASEARCLSACRFLQRLFRSTAVVDEVADGPGGWERLRQHAEALQGYMHMRRDGTPEPGDGALAMLAHPRSMLEQVNEMAEELDQRRKMTKGARRRGSASFRYPSVRQPR